MHFLEADSESNTRRDLHALAVTDRTCHAAFNQLLYQHDRDYNYRQDSIVGRSASSLGFFYNRPEIVRRAIELVPETCDMRHVSRTIESGVYEIAHELLDWESIRADMLGGLKDGWHPMFAAVRSGHMDLIDHITSICSPSHRQTYESSGMTLLDHACAARRVELVRRFLDEGAELREMVSVSSELTSKQTTLSWAMFPGWDEKTNEEHLYAIVEELLTRYPHLSQMEQHLSQAALAGREDILDLLLERGAPFPSDQARLQELLHAAIRGDSFSIVKRVLENGVDVRPHVADVPSLDSTHTFPPSMSWLATAARTQ